MLGLYRTGRHKDAVGEYLRWRGRALKEIGAAPSPAVRDLNNRITGGDQILLAEPLGYDMLR
jgi:DNA-binding SARP family transcriptional activator